MNQPLKQLTAEEICRRRERTQKKKDKKKQADVQAKEEAVSAQLGITSRSDKKKDLMLMDKAARGGWVPTIPPETLNCIGPNGEWLVIESPSHWNVRELNVGWPWIGAPSQLLTQAPYAVNEHNFEEGFFKLPQEVQASYLFFNSGHLLIILDLSFI